jgi:hypothetical protein
VEAPQAAPLAHQQGAPLVAQVAEVRAPVARHLHQTQVHHSCPSLTVSVLSLPVVGYGAAMCCWCRRLLAKALGKRYGGRVAS